MSSSLSQQDLEIVVARELRKAGLGLSGLHVRRRTPLAEPEGRYVMLLEGRLRVGAGEAQLLVECHDRGAPLDGERVRAFCDEARGGSADRAMVVSTSGFAPSAVVLGDELGIALLAIVDGASAWQSSPWSSGRPPAWFPEFVAQLLVADETGLVRAELLEPNRPEAVLSHLRPQPRAKAPPAA